MSTANHYSLPDNTDDGLWEILVPAANNDGVPYEVPYHQIWDAFVRNLTGGLTLLKPTTGQWISDEMGVVREQMIPVRIVCREDEIEQIITYTLEHYDQEAVLAYKLATDVKLRHR